MFDATKIMREFMHVYQHDIMPNLKGYEVLRQRLKRKISLLRMSVGCATLAIFILFVLLIIFIATNHQYYSLMPYFPVAILVVFFSVFFLIEIMNKHIFNIEKSYSFGLKKTHLPNLLIPFKDLQWSNNKGVISKEELIQSNLFYGDADPAIDDEICGKYNNIEFKVSEIDFDYYRRNKASENFNGIVLLFKTGDFKEYKTVISSKYLMTAVNANEGHKFAFMFGFVFILIFFLVGLVNQAEFILPIVALMAIVFSIIYYANSINFLKTSKYGCSNDKFKKVKLDIPKLNNVIDVYSTNEFDCLNDISPAFIQKILSFAKYYNSNSLKCSFFEDKFMLAISTSKNLFEIGDFKKDAMEIGNADILFDEIMAIYQIIDSLIKEQEEAKKRK